MIALVLASLALVWTIALFGDAAMHMGSLRRLRSLPTPPREARLPSVTIVVAARDEEEHVEAAVRALLALDYPNCDVLVVDDRSTDATGAILDRLAAENPHLRLVHVRELPPGWLGKNHALHVGARSARTDWILFADADVMLERTALRRAIAYATARGLDHLAVGPEVISPTFALRFAVEGFTTLFAMGLRLWRVPDHANDAFVGVGAFNLVRREALRNIGGLRRIRLRPDDDVKLGKVLKRFGYRQEIVDGRGMVSVEWYPTLPAMVRGLEKNTFAGAEYSVALVAIGSAATALLFIAPYVGPFVVEGAARWIFATAAVLQLAAIMGGRLQAGQSPWWALGMPIQTGLMLAMMWNSTVRALWRGGIVWRGTLYPLRDLRRNRV